MACESNYPAAAEPPDLNKQIAAKFEDLLETLVSLVISRTGSKRERRMLSIVRTSPSAECRLTNVDGDPQAIIEYATAELCHQFGFIEGELDGQNIKVIIPKRLHKIHDKHIATYIAGPRMRHMGAPGMVLIGRKKSGEEVPVQVSLYPFYDDGDLCVTFTVFVVPPVDDASRSGVLA